MRTTRKRMRSKPKMTVCTNMERKPVFIFRKSTGRFLPGIWKINPGARNANSAVAMMGAPQSFILKLTALSDPEINLIFHSDPPLAS